MNFVKWLSTPQAKIMAAATKEKALAEFKERFLNADMSQFTTEVESDEKITQQDKSQFMVRGPEWLQNPDEVNEKNWSPDLRVALGFANIPHQLMLSKNEN